MMEQKTTIDLGEHMDMLGHRVEDRVTGYRGVVTSVSFDLYGCVQMAVTPPFDPEQKSDNHAGRWLDACRLEKLQPERVLDPPASFFEPAGPAEKPEPT